MRRKIFAAAGALFISAALSMTAWAGTWQQQQASAPGPGAQPAGWRYQLDDGSYASKGWLNDQGKWYYLGQDGIMLTGFIKVAGSWYYLDDTGAMVSGTTKVIEGKEYAFDESGAMKVEAAGSWDGNTYTSNKFHYQVTFPEGFLPLADYFSPYSYEDEEDLWNDYQYPGDYLPLTSDEDVTIDLATAAPDLTVSMMVLVFRDVDEEFKGMTAKQLAESVKSEFADMEGLLEVGKIEMVTLGGSEYAKLPLSYTDVTKQDLYLRRMGDDLMMIQIVYALDKKSMADGIMRSVK